MMRSSPVRVDVFGRLPDAFADADALVAPVGERRAQA
jgi:hypothetical protein